MWNRKLLSHLSLKWRCLPGLVSLTFGPVAQRAPSGCQRPGCGTAPETPLKTTGNSPAPPIPRYTHTHTKVKKVWKTVVWPNISIYIHLHTLLWWVKKPCSLSLWKEIPNKQVWGAILDVQIPLMWADKHFVLEVEMWFGNRKAEKQTTYMCDLRV